MRVGHCARLVPRVKHVLLTSDQKELYRALVLLGHHGAQRLKRLSLVFLGLLGHVADMHCVLFQSLL